MGRNLIQAFTFKEIEIMTLRLDILGINEMNKKRIRELKLG